jgi:hypothetical protein
MKKNLNGKKLTSCKDCPQYEEDCGLKRPCPLPDWTDPAPQRTDLQADLDHANRDRAQMAARIRELEWEQAAHNASIDGMILETERLRGELEVTVGINKQLRAELDKATTLTAKTVDVEIELGRKVDTLSARVAASETKFAKFIQSYNAEVRRDNEWGESVRACTDALSARVSALESGWNALGPKLDAHIIEVAAALAKLEAAVQVTETKDPDSYNRGYNDATKAVREDFEAAHGLDRGRGSAVKHEDVRGILKDEPEWPEVEVCQYEGGNAFFVRKREPNGLARAQAEAVVQAYQAIVQMATEIPPEGMMGELIGRSTARRILKGEGK